MTSLQDVHFAVLHEENGSDWKLVCDVSPRTLKLRGQFHGAVISPIREAEPESDEAEPCAQSDNKIPCTICDMVLNGPHQLQDHLKGKRHRSNVARLRGQGCVVVDGRKKAKPPQEQDARPEEVDARQQEVFARQDEVGASWFWWWPGC